MRKDKEFGVLPVIAAAEEFLFNDLKLVLPVRLGEYTSGMPTGIGAPLFKGKIAMGDDPIPVWPDALGSVRGVEISPIHSVVPQALQ